MSDQGTNLSPCLKSQIIEGVGGMFACKVWANAVQLEYWLIKSLVQKIRFSEEI